MIPKPGPSLPGLGELELEDFWVRFEVTAPWHLRLALRWATCLVGGMLPLLLGYRATLPKLTPAAREEVLQRGHRLPLFQDLLMVVKVVACLAYFDAEGVQAQVRS